MLLFYTTAKLSSKLQPLLFNTKGLTVPPGLCARRNERKIEQTAIFGGACDL